jgi:beta-hydroxylase
MDMEGSFYASNAEHGFRVKTRPAHLGLSCPPEAAILVDGRRYSWRDGEDVLFDDTYVHEVANESATRPRVVLFCDVEARMAGPLSDWAARKACDLFGPLTTRANDKTEARSRAA